MRMNHRLALFALLLGALALGAGAARAAPDAELLGKCTICHGEQGISLEASYPTIAGLPVRLLTGDLTTSPSTAAKGHAQISYL